MEESTSSTTHELQQQAKRHFWRGSVALLVSGVLMKDDMNSLYHLAHDAKGITGAALAMVGIASVSMAIRRDNQRQTLDYNLSVAQERGYDAAVQLQAMLDDLAELESASEAHDWEQDITY